MIANLTRSRAARLRRSLLFGAGVVLAGVIAAPLPSFGAVAKPDVAYTKLTLLNGWGIYSTDSATPAVADINGIVQFKGAISTSSSNTNDVAFILPSAFRPSKNVVVPVDMCDATGGELSIAPTGVTEVISEGAFSSAACFTSLDGASFALSPKSFTALKLAPSWRQFDSLYRKAAARLIGGVVHLEGEIRPTSNKAITFKLPAALRPSKDVNVLINVCTGSIGRLHITPKGVVSVRSEEGFWAVKCGTSLDGATFALSPKSFTALKLQNGWVNAPSGTAKATLRTISGVVRLRGAIKTSGSNADPFVLPSGFRPVHDVYVAVDLCNGGNGRLFIQPDGVVEVEAQSSFTDAQCLTSLDGVSFVP